MIKTRQLFRRGLFKGEELPNAELLRRLSELESNLSDQIQELITRIDKKPDVDDLQDGAFKK